MLGICLSITAFLILVALHKESLLHTPPKLLYRNLAATDLCVGIIVDPLAITCLIAVMKQQRNICRYAVNSIFIISYILCSVSLLTLTAISVDRLLALFLGLRYRQIVTLKKTYLAIIVFWAVSIVGTTMSFWDPRITSWIEKIALPLCLVTSVFFYTGERHGSGQFSNTFSNEKSHKKVEEDEN